MSTKHPNLKLSFYVGSFLELPKEVLSNPQKFTHVFSQAALCHAHNDLSAIFKGLHGILDDKSGVLILNDCVSDEVAGEMTKKYVYERMKFDTLISSETYRKVKPLSLSPPRFPPL